VVPYSELKNFVDEKAVFIACKFKQENSKLFGWSITLFNIFIICLILQYFSKSILKVLEVCVVSLHLRKRTKPKVPISAIKERYSVLFYVFTLSINHFFTENCFVL